MAQSCTAANPISLFISRAEKKTGVWPTFLEISFDATNSIMVTNNRGHTAEQNFTRHVFETRFFYPLANQKKTKKLKRWHIIPPTPYTSTSRFFIIKLTPTYVLRAMEKLRVLLD